MERCRYEAGRAVAEAPPQRKTGPNERVRPMDDELEANVETFTAEVLARRLIEQYGDQADIQAALNADHFYVRDDEVIVNIWHEATKIISAVQAIVRARGAGA